MKKINKQKLSNDNFRMQIEKRNRTRQ